MSEFMNKCDEVAMAEYQMDQYHSQNDHQSPNQNCLQKMPEFFSKNELSSRYREKFDTNSQTSDQDDSGHSKNDHIVSDNDTKFSPIAKIDEADSSSQASENQPDQISPNIHIVNKAVAHPELQEVKHNKNDQKDPTSRHLLPIFNLLIASKPKQKKFKNKKAALIQDENADLNIVSSNKKENPKSSAKSASNKTKVTTKTITTVEHHSSSANSQYMKVFSANSNKFLQQETINAMKQFSKNLEKQTKKATKKLKRKRSKPGRIDELIPKLKNLRKRAKSPSNLKEINKRLGCERRMLDNLRKRRRSVESTKSTIRGLKPNNNAIMKLRKRSPWAASGSKKTMKKTRKRKAKSPPNLVVPPAIQVKRPTGQKDNSMVVMLRLNFS